MRLTGDPVHVSDVEDPRVSFTPAQLVRLHGLYLDARETAECGLDQAHACATPKPSEECQWGPTAFCAARLIIAGKRSSELDASSNRTERLERAEVMNIPLWSYKHLGMNTGIQTLRETEALDVVRANIRERTEPGTRKVIHQRCPLVVLAGPDGAGKRTAAAWWCWHLGGWYYQGTKIMWWTPKGGWRPEPDDYRLLSAPIVAIVGVDKPWANKEGVHRRNLLHVLHERLNAGKTTLLTTNLSHTDIEPLLGGSLMRTLSRDGSLAVVSELVDGTRQERQAF